VDPLSILVGIAAGGGVALGLVTFLSKSLLRHLLEKDLKRFELQFKQIIDDELERTKGAIAYRNALGVARIDHLRALWEATHAYGGAVAGLASGAGDAAQINTAIENFKTAFSRAGAFLGHERFELLYSMIGEPFLERLVAVRSDPGVRRQVFEDFMYRQWPAVLTELEQLIVDPSRSVALLPDKPAAPGR
jgi:hypothetical protein